MIIPVLMLAMNVAVAESRTEVGAGIGSTGSSMQKGPLYRGFFRTGSGALLLEGGASYSPDRGLDSVGGLVHTLVSIGAESGGETRFQVPFELDTWSAYALADWSFVPREYMNTWTGGPRLLAGGGVAGTNTYYATYDDSAAEPPFTRMEPQGSQLRKFVIAGVSLDFWKDGDWGLRITQIDRIHRDVVAQYDPSSFDASKQFYHRWQASLDLLIRLK